MSIIKNKTDRTGEEKLNTFGSRMIIIAYRRCDDIDVYFPEYNWICKNIQYTSFKNGYIKCPYEKRHYNIGYIGEGNYKEFKKGRHSKCYETWHRMLQRCYSEKYQEKQPTYKGCTVCEEWLCFQNFAKWFYENYYDVEGQRMNLDKDILIKGNKIYSPKTCIFLPQRINNLFTKRQNDRGNMPIGVRHYGNKYQARCNDGTDKIITLNSCNTLEEAFQDYKNYKEELIKQVADEYKDKIPEKLYNAMYNYKVEIDD